MLPNKIIKPQRKYNQKGSMRYSTKSYSNPFFTRKKRHSIDFNLDNIKFNFSFQFKIIFLVILVLIISLIWGLFYSRFFIINNFEISGSGRIDAESVKKIAERQTNNTMWWIFPQKNIFFFSKDKLRKNLETGYSFEKLDIIKDLPGTLKVNFQEKEYAVIWVENERYFYADKLGNIITETTPLEITEKNYPLIYNFTSNPIVENKIASDLKYINAAIFLFDVFRKDGQLFIEKFIIDSEVDTVKIKIQEAGEIYFDINEDMEEEYHKLIILKNERLKEDFNKKIYIDLRNGDNIYYR